MSKTQDDITLDTQSLCGRPTRSGTPCRNRRQSRLYSACTQHMTDAERLASDTYDRAYSEGRRVGMADRAAIGCGHDTTIEHLQHRITELEEKLRGERLTDGGCQVVELNHRYAYRWRRGEEPLEVGEEVVIPANWFAKSPSVMTVTALGTTYKGDLATILRRARNDS